MIVRTVRVRLARGGPAALLFAAVILGGVAAAVPGGAVEPPATEPAPPEMVTFPSHVGEVTFPHAMHAEDLGIECTDCHHPVTAPKLVTPHPEAFEGCSVQCTTCHGRVATGADDRRCTTCHTARVDAAHDAIPSAKVALHQTCSACHEVGTGPDASASCTNCHSGPKEPW